MRLPTQIEDLYLDFEGFFASVEQLRDPSLREWPVGVVPYEGPGRICIIACGEIMRLAMPHQGDTAGFVGGIA